MFNRLLGVTWAVAATIVEEGTAAPLDVDLGARVGLRWPVGPFGLYNKLEPAKREAAIGSFRDAVSRLPAAGFTLTAAIHLSACPR